MGSAPGRSPAAWKSSSRGTHAGLPLPRTRSNSGIPTRLRARVWPPPVNIGWSAALPVTDLRAAYVQTLADGELYYIITNGVRFTGMPAWGGEHTPEQTWQLVAFIRRLPTLSPEELKQMEELATTGSAAGPAHEAGSKAHRH